MLRAQTCSLRDSAQNGFRTIRNATVIGHRRPSPLTLLSIVLAATVIAFGWTAISVNAQGGNDVVITSVQTQERDADVLVETHFYLRDEAGNPLSSVEIDRVTMELQDTDAEAAVAEVGRPSAPLFVAVLIDISGSMADNIREVQDAAKAAIENAPPEAQFAIIQFNLESRVVQDFSQDRLSVRSAIDRIDQPEGATCLYDTIYTALELLADRTAGNPLGRRAVIAFTDGQDQLRIGTNEPCSQHSYGDVVSAAARGETPIHTIGIFAQRGDIDENELRGMARESGGFSAIGSRNEVSGLFNEIFRGLGVQYVARAALKPGKGSQRAILAVTPRGAPNSLLDAFEFVSSKDYATPPPTLPPPTSTPLPNIGVLIESIIQDSSRGVYDVTLNVSDPALVDRLLITVEEDSGQQRYSNEIVIQDSPVLAVQIPAANLRDGREYTIRVKGVRSGEQIPKPTEQAGLREDDPFVLATKTFTHEIPPPPPVEVVVRAVNEPDLLRNTLTFDVEINDPTRVQVIQGAIYRENVKLTEWRDAYDGPLVTIEIPDEMMATAGITTYHAQICAEVEGQEVCSEQYEFPFNAPAPPGFFRRIGLALQENPLIWALILVVIFGLVGWLFFGRRGKKDPFTLEKAPVDQTMIGPAIGGGTAKGAKLRIRVTQTPAEGDRVERIITKFPCVIGRQDSCDIKFIGDRQISRKHARFLLVNEEIFIEDLGSAGGTFVDNVKLEPNVRQKLKDVQPVRLGGQTNMEVHIQYHQ